MPRHAPATPSATLVGDVEQFVRDLVTDLEPEPAHPGPGRPRIVPSLALWAGLLVCVVRGWSSQRALWRVLTLTGLWHYPRLAVTDEAVYKRLAQAGTAPLERLFTQVSTLLATRLATWPVVGASDLAAFAAAVVAIDETTLDPVARTLPSLRGTPTAASLPEFSICALSSGARSARRRTRIRTRRCWPATWWRRSRTAA